MKQIYNITLIACIAILFSCQDDSASLSQVGYLRLSVAESGQLNTRAYDPKIMHVEIKSEDGEIIKQTDDLDEWEGEVFELPVGNYGIVAYSKDYQREPAFNSPYYYGDTTVQVKAATETKAKVDCKIANVKVTVNYSEDFKSTFAGRDIFVTVGSAEDKPSFSNMTFKYGSEAALYLPSDCGPLKATLSVSKPDGGYYTLDETKRLAEPKANDHFILNYQMGDTNKGDFTVTVDPTTNSYSYTFYINMTPLKVSAKYETVNAWATFAYLEASNVEADGEVEPATVKFNYRKKGEQEWQEIVTTELNGTYTARPTNLESKTTYEYCLAVDGIQANMGSEFTTEEAKILENGSFEKWCEKKASTALISNTTTFPCSAEEYEANTRFWDTSNRGANSLEQKDPTKSTTHSIKGKAAELKTIKVAGFLAAASLYTGDFEKAAMSGSATLNFGKPFTSRPIALRGYYQYLPKTINELGKDLPNEATVSVNNPDQCSIYIALAKKSYTIDNSKPETFIDFAYDDNIIAYGVLESGNATPGDGYVDLNIPLRYKEELINEIPTHIIIVCSASKYGDYFTGGEGSTLYIDELTLDYEGEPIIWPKSERPDK